MKEKFDTYKIFTATFAFFCVLFSSNNLLAQCPGLGSITLNVAAAPDPVLNAPPALCTGVTGNVSVSPAFASYDWNTGGTGQSIAIAGPGTFTVTVTNTAGCTATESVTVASSAAPTPGITQNPYDCNGQAALNAGNGYTSYAWSNSGGSSQVATFNNAGPYTVTVTNAAGCTGTDEFNVVIPPPPVVAISGNLSFCSGLNTALNATPGFASYSWSGGGNTATYTALTAGNYTVTATDVFGCTDTETATITTIPSPVPLVAGGQICPGGTFSVNVSNGPFSAYDWNVGGMGSNILVGLGNYTVTVTAANGCTGTAAASVTQYAVPVPVISQAVYNCNGQITLNAGAGFASYNWSNGPVTPGNTVNNPGPYIVTVTNSDGCTGTDIFNVTIPVPPAVSITGNNSFCAGLSTVLNASAGLSSYSWSTGQNGQNISVSNTGTFTVTATDNFGCTATSSFSTTQVPAPQPVVAGPPSVCEGINATLNTTLPFVSYSWSNGFSTPSINTTVAGTYTVTVTDANNCTGTDSQVLSVIPAPNPVVSVNPYNCNGQQTLNAGAGFTGYAWSNSGSAQTTTVSTAGNYTVTVTNASGCTGTDELVVTIPVAPVVGITGDNSFCDGEIASLDASPGLVLYNWSNGQNGQSITVLNGGTFTVTATDNFGCTATANFTTTQLPAPQPVIAGPAAVCAGIFATLNTTTSFISYNWSNSQTTPSINVNIGNTYTVTVTAANGCTGTDSQVLAVTPAPTPVISEAFYLCDQQLTLQVPSGFTSYSWSNGTNGPGIIISTSDTYTVTVTNAAGCTGTDLYFAVIPTPPLVNITGSSTICPGGSTTLISGAGFSIYQWSNSANTPNINVNTTGNFTVTVTDAFGCTTTDEFSVSSLPAPTPNISGPSQICASGNATFAVPGTFSNINWSTGVNTPTITVNTAATYTVTVTAANGCTATDTQILTVSNSLQPQITESPYLCTGQITLDAGTGFSSYSWSGSQTTQSINVTADDTYIVTVSDAGGCTGTAAFAVAIPQVPVVAITGNASICGGTATTLTATPGLDTYIWNTGQVGNTISASTAGTFTVTATDVFGCSATSDFLVNSVTAPTPVITGPAVICTNSTGTLALSGTFSFYNWSTGATTANIPITTGNTYSVTVTNAAGCTGTDSQLVTESTALSPTVVQLPYNCNGIQTLDAGAGYSSYLWSGSETTATISANTGGTYLVTVTDGTGCTGTGTFDVTIPVAPQVAISGVNSFCQNASTTLEATTGFAGYLWNSSQTTGSITVNQSGTFTVTITDNLGCTDTESITVTAQPLPQPVIAGPAAICAGNSASFSLGQSFVSYVWSDGTTGAGITTANAGTFTVVVTDVNGCTGTDDISFIVNNNPAPAITELPYACDGQIVLDATAGFNTYSWSNSGNTATQNLSQSGSYTVTVTDANGCTGTVSQAIIVPALTQVTIGGPVQFCGGGSTNLLAASGFVSYQWSNSASSPGINTNLPGVYEVTATDGLGCKSTATATVSLFPTPMPVISGPQTVCPGNTATLSAGGNFTGFIWDTGETTSGITVQPPFTATVTVTDVNGCTGTASASVAISTQLTPTIVQLPYNCDAQVTLDAGAGFPNYSWSNTGNTSTINISQSGTYTVTVSDGGGCSGTAIIDVTVPTLSQVTITGDSKLCPAEISTLTATSGFVTYNWSNSSNTQIVDINTAGTYDLTVTDGLGCTATSSIDIVDLSPPVPVITGPATICGTNPVTLSVNAPFTTIAWSNSANTTGITINTPGTFTVTVTDGNGCTGSASQTLSPGGSITANVTVLPYNCNDQLTLDAGTGFVLYNWSNSGSAQTTQVNQSGLYTVTVSDANGCSGTATVQANIPVLVPPQVYSVPSLCPGASITSVVLNQQNFVQFEWNTGWTQSSLTGVIGGQTYTITVTDANGCTQTAGFSILLAATPLPTAVPPSSGCITQLTLEPGGTFSGYLWSTGSTTQNTIVTQSGIYTVTVTDIAGCTGTGTVQATIPAGPVVNITGATSFCLGSSTVLTADAGFAGYLWNTGSALAALPVTAPGTYTVTVTDATGCTATTSATVETKELTPALQSNEVFCEGTSLTLVVTGNYESYSWSDGSSGSSLTVSQVGFYTVTVTDASGCSGTASSEVLAVPPASVSISGNSILCGGSALFTTSGSVGTFEWSNGGTGADLTITTPGIYTVTVTDANGCTATDSAAIEAGGEPAATIINRQTCLESEAGVQVFTFTAANGCDSIVTITTTYQPTKPGLTLDLGPTIEVKPGEEASFDVTSNFPLDSVVYQSPFLLSCIDCYSPTFIADVAGVIGVTAFDPDGCFISGELLVKISSKIDVFVPNTFQPGSTDNGYISVFSGPEISFVRNFNVYDRWGNALFSRDDMPTNDPSAGWDGTFRNKKMSPGVYVYYFEVNLADGSTVVYKGDVTIID